MLSHIPCHKLPSFMSCLLFKYEHYRTLTWMDAYWLIYIYIYIYICEQRALLTTTCDIRDRVCLDQNSDPQFMDVPNVDIRIF